MTRKSFYISIITFIIGAISLAQASATTPVFSKCIDRELNALLKIIIVGLDEGSPVDPTSRVETEIRAENVMRMIRKYFVEERRFAMSSNRRNRKFFFWPFQPWLLNAYDLGLQGSVIGSWVPGGYILDAAINGGFNGQWKFTTTPRPEIVD